MRIIFLLIAWIFISGIGGGVDSRQELGTGCDERGTRTTAKCSLPIIPGVSGYGVATTAGSGPDRIGGAIIHVTNLNSSGTGSMREAINFAGPRVIVFDVSGYIDITLDGEKEIL